MVSVIVPYKEDRGFLKQCLDSIKAQTYKDFELIEAHGHGTLPQNFNWGLSRASGEFIKMVQDDDWIPPDSLKYLVGGIGDYPWAVANVWQHPVDRHDKPTSPPYIQKPLYGLDFMSNWEHYGLHMGSTLYRRDILEGIGGMDETLETGEEYDMHLKLLWNGYIPVHIDKEVYHYRMWAGGKSVIYRKNRTEWRKNELAKIKARYFLNP
jgi:glycosyltransferase involved in cell wall biosynthesis